jgi:hypothetical protein
MNDNELRALVRDAVARHLGRRDDPDPSLPILTERAPVPGYARHASHAQYLTLVNIGDDCVIEPSVKCNHCGYCKSHGH